VTIERNWNIALDEERILAVEGERLMRVLGRPDGRAAWDAALEDARALARPAACWVFLPVEGIRHDRVVLSDGATLGGGPLAAVVAGATDLAVIVCTIGPGLETRAREHSRGGDMLRGLLLDTLGTWMVDALRQEICRSLEADACAAGLRVSTALSPGESAWGLADQTVIFSLVDTRSIGVSLGASLLMTPVKSLSLVMGRGPGPLGREGESHCDYCTMRDRCAYREHRDPSSGKD